MPLARWLVVLACALGASSAFAAPAKRPAKPRATPDGSPAQPSASPPATVDKQDAKSLMQSGLKLFAAKDFLGALAVFKTAYSRFPSAKILLNIGTTLTKLDRKAEAANVYQRYLDSQDADPAKRGEVKKVLAELDAAVATLELSITPADSEVQFNDDEWIAATGETRHRVAAGPVTVRVRHAEFTPGEKTVQAAAGASLPITIALAEIPPPPPAPAPAFPVDSGLRTGVVIEPPRSRTAVMALAHVDITNRGGAGVVGVSVDVTDRLQAQIAAILGPSYGGYAGLSVAVLDGKLRPIVAAGVPIFISNGARIAIRGAGGVELALNRHLAVIAELGVEHVFNPEADIKHTTSFIPALGAAGRL